MSKAADLANLIGNINAGGGGVNRNVIINGAMNVAQRGTSTTGLGADADTIPTCDRWFHSAQNTAGRFTMTQDSSAPSGFANSIKLDCTTADTSIAAGEVLLLRQKIEGQNVQMFAKGTSDAKPYALSFYVKANASATYVAELMDNDNSNRHVNQTFTVGTDWSRVEISFPADTTGAFDDDNGDSLNLNIWLHAGSTRNPASGSTLQTTWGALDQSRRCVGISSFFSSTDNTFFITGVQLEVGQNPTEFEHEPYEETLKKASRYFHKVSGANQVMGIASYYSSSTVICNYYFPVPMRASPTLSVDLGSTGNQSFIAYSAGSTDYIDTAGLNFPNQFSCMPQFGSGSGTAGNAAQIISQYSDQSFEFAAEL